MKKLLLRNIQLFALLVIGNLTGTSAQEKNFIDQPYLDTTASIDTLVVPDRIYLGIEIKEVDTKGRTSVEELENRMATKLKALGIDLEKQLMISDLSSDFRGYFLRKTDVQKSKAYTLLVYDGLTAGKVIKELEAINIANIILQKTEYSRMEQLKTSLRQKAVRKAQEQANSLLEPLGQPLGKAIYILDQTDQLMNSYRTRMAGMQLDEVVVTGSGKYEPIDIYFEKIQVQSTVSIKFAIQ